MRKLTHDEFMQKFKNHNEHYNDIEVIGQYERNDKPIKCRCKICGEIWNPTPNSLISGRSCLYCGYKTRVSNRNKSCVTHRKTHDEFMEEYYQNNLYSNQIEIIDKYTDAKTKILCKCNQCGQTYYFSPRTLLRGNGCSICQGKDVLQGYNDIATERPDLVKYFLNKDDSHKYRVSSNKTVDICCPDCGYIHQMEITKLSSRGFSCPRCSDKISYPNKFLRAFLEQIPVKNVQYEYSPKWARPYRYDGYCEYNGQKIIIEMDGALGHGKHKYRSSDVDIDGKKRDLIKNQLADKNGILLIRIDCAKSDMEYIKANILNSVLNDIFDLSQIDWGMCEKKSMTNLIKDVCFYYNTNDCSLEELSSVFHRCTSTIKRYLRKGNQFNWCHYN